MKQWSISAGPAATLLAVGDKDNPVPTLIQNVDPLNTLYVGNDVGINPSNPLTCAPLPAGQSIVADGSLNVFGIAAAGQTVAVNTYHGMTSFFLPASLSSIGGAAVFVQATTPVSTGAGIPVNSLWFNTATQSMLVWSGSTWVQQQFSGSQLIVAATILSAQIQNAAITTAKIATGAVGAAQVASGSLTSAQLAAAAGILGSQIANATVTAANIAANTIVAANIAANTITAAQLAAGIVYAGIIDGTEVRAQRFIGTNAAGEAFFYSGSAPAAGTLVNSIAGASGTDTVTNPYPSGFYGQQLTLANQSSAPTSFANSSVFYSSLRGRPRYIMQTGDDSVLERGVVNVAQFTPSAGNTVAAQISAQIAYQPLEGSQSSQYEIEIDGLITCPSGGSGSGPTLTFGFAIDGTVQGGSCTIGATVFGLGTVGFAFSVRSRLAILTTGTSGTVIMVTDGAIHRQATNAGNNLNDNVPVGTNSGGTTKNMDTTIAHTFQIMSQWGSTPLTGHSITTYLSRITRRM